MGYKVGDKIYNYDSVNNQIIKDKFVDREVLCCMTSEVEYIIMQGVKGNTEDIPFDESDIENYCETECSECKGGEFEWILPGDLEDSELETNASYKDEDEALQYFCPVCEIEYGTPAEAKVCCGSEQLYRCCECHKIYTEEEYEELNGGRREVYEWWAVTGWLGNKLKFNNEVVIEAWGKWYWGRCTTGQGISSDDVINSICRDMEILEGQSYDWSKQGVA